MLGNPVREGVPVVCREAVMLPVKASHDAIEFGLRAIARATLLNDFLDGFTLPESPTGDRASLLQLHEEAVSQGHTVFMGKFHNLIYNMFHDI